jgi:hypothetical protein
MNKWNSAFVFSAKGPGAAHVPIDSAWAQYRHFE